MFESTDGNAQNLDYSFLLLTHLMCADQQIHNKEWQYLRQVENTLMVNISTKEEQDKIITQDATMLSVETVAKMIVKTEHNHLTKKLLALAHIDEVYSPLEQVMIENVGKIWGLNKSKIQSFMDNHFQIFLNQAIKEVRESRNFLVNDKAYYNALEQCTKIAQEDYKFTQSTLQQTQTILEKLSKGITQQLKDHQFDNNKGQYTTKKEVLKQLQETEESLKTNIIKETDKVVDSLHSKGRSLKHFTIAFMGKTKAGKSTLHAIMTGEGWEAIGVGKQRTTRLNRVYEWQNIRIIDTPGIGAPGGKTDEEIAENVIDEADIICYVVTNDSIQETEFKFLQQLKEKAKPLIVLLNLKYNLRDSRRLQHFLKNPDKIFKKDGKDGLEGHILRIRRYAKEHYSNDYFPIIPVMLLAAQMSQEITIDELSETLLKASQIDTFFTAIRESIIDYGSIRRSQTLLGSTVGNIQQPNQWIKQQLEAYQNLTNTLYNKSQTIQRDMKKSQKESRLFLEQKINDTFEKAMQIIPSFAEDYWEADQHKLQTGWKRALNQIKFEEQVKKSYQEASQKFNQEVQETLEEVGHELQVMTNLNGHKFKLEQQDSEAFMKDLLKIGGGLLAVIGAGVGLFIPPVGIIVGLTGTAINIFSRWFKSKHEKRREAVQNIRTSLESQLKKQQQDTLKQARNEFDSNCDDIAKKINNYFSILIEELKIISEKLNQSNKDLEKTHEFLNRAYGKRIIDYSSKKYQTLTEANINTTIAKVDRKFGDRIEIKTKQLLDLRVKQSQLEQILQEKISITDLIGDNLLQ